MNRRVLLLSKIHRTFDDRPVEPLEIDDPELPIPIMLALATAVSLAIWYGLWMFVL